MNLLKEIEKFRKRYARRDRSTLSREEIIAENRKAVLRMFTPGVASTVTMRTSEKHPLYVFICECRLYPHVHFTFRAALPFTGYRGWYTLGCEVSKNSSLDVYETDWFSDAICKAALLEEEYKFEHGIGSVS